MIGLSCKCALDREHTLWLRLGESQAWDIADGPLPCFLGFSWDPSVLDIYLAGLCRDKMNDGFIP